MIPTVEWKDGIVRMLDQTKLPLETIYIQCKDYQTVARGIKEMWVRGAPAIGIAAAMGLALGARQISANAFDEFWQKFEEVCSAMAATRPTAKNLFWAIERIAGITTYAGRRHRNEQADRKLWIRVCC